MRQLYIPFFVFLALLLLLVSPLSFGFLAPVTSGSKVVVLPKYLTEKMIVSAPLLLAVVGYRILPKFLDNINYPLVIAHFALTLPVIIFLKSPTTVLDAFHLGQEELFSGFSLTTIIIVVLWVLFALGQILFSFYFFSRIKK